MMKKTLEGPEGVRIELDSSEIFPDDPGAGTPAMVYQGTGSATYWCAAAEGETDGGPLSERVCEWLDDQEDEVEEFMKEHTPETA